MCHDDEIELPKGAGLSKTPGNTYRHISLRSRNLTQQINVQRLEAHYNMPETQKYRPKS